MTLHEISDLGNIKYPKLQNNKTKSIEGSGAGRNEAYFLIKPSGQNIWVQLV